MKNTSMTKFAGIFLFTLMISGCIRRPEKQEPTVYEEGYFKYIHIGDNSSRQKKEDRSIAIVGFTESGLEQEKLDIPQEINGNQVKYLGFEDKGHSSDDSRELKCGEKLKKLYIFDSIEHIDYFHGHNVQVMVCTNKKNFYVKFMDMKEMFFSRELFSNIYPTSEVTRIPGNSRNPANIVFKKNVSNNSDDLYRIDNVEENETIDVPPAPVVDNYVFNGWYTEPECINLWDFKNKPTFSESEEFVLYAGWDNI